MSKPKIRITSVLIAEDVRQEVSGQQTLIGVFGNNINTPKASLTLPLLAVRVAFESDESFEALCTLAVISPSKKQVFVIPEPLTLPVRSGVTATCVIRWGPVSFEEPGMYQIRFGVDGKDGKEVSRFRIGLSTAPSPRLGGLSPT